jgi:hypothetical protein
MAVIKNRALSAQHKIAQHEKRMARIAQRLTQVRTWLCGGWRGDWGCGIREPVHDLPPTQKTIASHCYTFPPHLPYQTITHTRTDRPTKQLESGGSAGAVESDPEDPSFALGTTIDELQMQQVCACMHACVRACVRACMGWVDGWVAYARDGWRGAENELTCLSLICHATQAEESSVIEELQRVIEDEKRKFKAWKVRERDVRSLVALPVC